MKLFALTITFCLAAATVIPVAAEVPTTKVPTTKAECEQVGMRLKENAGRCRPLFHEHKLSFKIIGGIGLGCALVGFIVVCEEWRRGANGSVGTNVVE